GPGDVAGGGQADPPDQARDQPAHCALERLVEDATPAPRLADQRRESIPEDREAERGGRDRAREQLEREPRRDQQIGRAEQAERLVLTDQLPEVALESAARAVVVDAD